MVEVPPIAWEAVAGLAGRARTPRACITELLTAQDNQLQVSDLYGCGVFLRREVSYP
jgi:hypothetical protein